ncbi:MAG: transposase [Synechococcus sp. SB0669_bin_7]|nr:transposase [Synechococcus sp. SB0675_bin_7]MYK85919.1 transposase [Synechococcus sp. SB0669_bin_7]
MQVRYRYRLYPPPGQKQALARQFGWCPVVWNDILALSQSIYQEGRKYPGGGELQRRCITQAKRTEERSWLSEVSASVLQQSVRDLDKSFRFWWKSKGKVRWSRPLPSPPSSCTIIKDCAGRCFASFVVDLEDRDLSPVFGQNIGIDLGLASLAVTSDGEKIAPPKFLRAALKPLRRLQRNLKHKQRGSNRLALARLRVTKLHAKVADRRLDFLHKPSTRLIHENQAVYIEEKSTALACPQPTPFYPRPELTERGAFSKFPGKSIGFIPVAGASAWLVPGLPGDHGGGLCGPVEPHHAHRTGVPRFAGGRCPGL